MVSRVTDAYCVVFFFSHRFLSVLDETQLLTHPTLRAREFLRSQLNIP